MISVILYGRNDSYGYNLHKRAAISLNCISEILTDHDDEIIFVDYNTPDDFPTFPEAIFDTLTEKTINKLRILRVRPDDHESLFGSKTHLKTLEPVARNVAVRRSNKNNKWILSTNTDMIFVPRNNVSLTDTVRDIPEGIYCTARFEIPESIWETYDRLDPKSIIEKTKINGEELHLNEVINSHEWILYDGPGDFQLIQRKDVFAINGFDEKMLLGWHVDSNISKRLFLKYGSIRDALPLVFGYHCDHTRQITPMHKHNSPQNDLNDFVYQMNKIEALHQSKTWGMPNLDIEEISLKSKSIFKFRKVLKEVIDKPQEELTNSYYLQNNFNKIKFSPKHVLPFLVDLYSSMKKDIRILWVGEKDELFYLFSQALRKLDFLHQIEIFNPKQVIKEFKHIDSFIFHFASPISNLNDIDYKLIKNYVKIIKLESKWIRNKNKPRRFVTINSLHNHYEPYINLTLKAAKTPFSTRIRHGFIDIENIKKIDSKTFDNAKRFFFGNSNRSKLLEIIRKKNLVWIFRKKNQKYTIFGKIGLSIINLSLKIIYSKNYKLIKKYSVLFFKNVRNNF